MSDHKVTTLSIRLPQDLYEKLRQLGGERGLSTVVRQTLERGLAAEAPAASDLRTAALLRFVAAAAKALNDSYARPWWQSEVETEALRLAIEEAVRGYGNWPYRPVEDEEGKSVGWVPENPDPDWQPEVPQPPMPGSPLDHLLLHPGLRFRELTAALMAQALWPLREPMSPYDVPPIPPGKP